MKKTKRGLFYETPCRKSYTGFRLLPNSMTLDDPER